MVKWERNAWGAGACRRPRIGGDEIQEGGNWKRWHKPLARMDRASAAATAAATAPAMVAAGRMADMAATAAAALQVTPAAPSTRNGSSSNSSSSIFSCSIGGDGGGCGTRNDGTGTELSVHTCQISKGTDARHLRLLYGRSCIGSGLQLCEQLRIEYCVGIKACGRRL